MGNLRYVPAIVAIGVFVVLAALGTVWLAAHKKQEAFAQGVQACIAEVVARDPVAEVAGDLARGEDRFFFVTHDGVASGRTADGTGCLEGGLNADSRPGPFAMDFAYGENACCGHDPRLTPCGVAIDRYVRAYNRKLAQASPASLAKYCRQAGPQP